MSATRGEHAVVVVLAKAPRAGLVKTRMSPPLTPQQAADLYANLLDDVLDATGCFCRARRFEAVLSVHPPQACGALAHRAPQGFRIVAQQGRGLGERMAWAVAEAAATGATRILLRGSDNPVLPLERMEQAMLGLEQADLVISPDCDGGYGLIGLRRPVAGLFDHPMSTATVLDETLANGRRLGLRCALLEPSFDLDTVADFTRLECARESGAALLCPRTLAHFDAQDLWRYAPLSRRV